MVSGDLGASAQIQSGQRLGRGSVGSVAEAQKKIAHGVARRLRARPADMLGERAGAGGSHSGSLSLARDACLRSAREQGMNVARVDSAEEYAFGNNPPRGVKVVMQVRRDAFSVNTEQRVCRFSYANGTADISRT